MNVETAMEVLNIAAAGDYYDGPITNLEEDKLIEEAEFYYGHAKAALDSSSGDETCEKIVAVVNGSAPAAGYEPLPMEKPGEKPKVETTVDGMPLPRKPEGDAPLMPYDVTECSDKEIRRLQSQYNACLGYVRRNLSLVETQMMRADQLREAAFMEAYLAEENAMAEAGRKVSVTALKQAAQFSPKYQELNGQHFELDIQSRELRALVKIYEDNVTRLSREMTARIEDMRAQSRRH